MVHFLPAVFSCAATEAPCHADPGLGCIPTAQYCDGIAQCPGGTDEYCGGISLLPLHIGLAING